MTVPGVAADLLAEADRANERRLLVLAGDREDAYAAVDAVLGCPAVQRDRTTLVGPEGPPGTVLDCEQVPQANADRLLGTTRDAVVLDAHDGLRPNALGRVVGAVDGGGLLVLLTPPLDAWPAVRGEFDRTLAVPPFELSDVDGRFRARLVETLRVHPGIAIVDLDAGEVVRDGLTHPAPGRPQPGPTVPDDHRFPRAAYEACLTGDQSAAVAALEALAEPGHAVVVEADRGRGKSAAAGIAAGSLAAEGREVLVTAPGYRSASEVFERAAALLRDLGILANREDAGHPVLATGGGIVRFAPPVEAVERPGDPAVVLVDEAAALPVRVLSTLLDAPSVGFVTTVHGYEGAGRGFSVRFRDRLATSGLEVLDVSMAAPVRYAAGDPVEVWAFRALLLDASPAADQLVGDADPETVEYRALEPDDLLADEHRLREAFGLLVLAHYRTEPNDLARLLDAPNLRSRALLHDGHVAAVALLAEEGNLPADLRAAMYEGARVAGNMLPDVLTSQLRDEDAGTAAGLRVMRIATHPAVRSRGLGSRLLGAVRTEFDDLDWLGVGYGATPELLRFWSANGFGAVHLSTRRNEASGEYSVVMLDPLGDAGVAMHDRHARWFAERVRDVLSDALADADPDVVRATLRATDAAVSLDLDDRDWRVVADAAYGPGLFDAAPGPFRTLAMKHLVDPTDPVEAAAAADAADASPAAAAAEPADQVDPVEAADPADPTEPLGPSLLDDRQERLLVLKVLQARSWGAVTDELGYHSHGETMRALGRAFQPLVDAYGNDVARRQAGRFGDGE